MKELMLLLDNTAKEPENSGNAISIIIVVLCTIAILAWLFNRKKGNTTPEIQKEPPEPTPAADPTKPEVGNTAIAKQTFIKSIDSFIPLFRKLSDSKEAKEAWTDAVIDTNDFNLIAIWKLCVNKPFASWINILASWGIKAEKCTGLIYSELYNGMYITESEEDLQPGKEYIVTEPCWILTYEDADGITQKKVLLAGIIRKKY